MVEWVITRYHIDRVYMMYSCMFVERPNGKIERVVRWTRDVEKAIVFPSVDRAEKALDRYKLKERTIAVKRA